jgi:phytoene synthase
MQLTNIARDIGEDARDGRIYLPLDWMREAGLDPEAWLAAPAFRPEIADLAERLLAEAERLYVRSEAGIARLPLACRPGIRAARLLYAEIGAAIARQGYDSVSSRAFVPLRRKLSLLAQALVTPARGKTAPVPVLAESRFLVQAIEASIAAAPRVTRRTMSDQMVWVIELFERIERRRQVQGGI